MVAPLPEEKGVEPIGECAVRCGSDRSRSSGRVTGGVAGLLLAVTKAKTGVLACPLGLSRVWWELPKQGNGKVTDIFAHGGCRLSLGGCERVCKPPSTTKGLSFTPHHG